jgi:hypothetical protein
LSQSTWTYPINSWADLPGAIVASERAGAVGAAHLLRGLAAGRIGHLPLLPDMSNGKFREFIRGTSHKPAIVLIGDDDGMDRGPAGWRLTARALRWANSVLLHAAAAELDHYEAAILTAEVRRRVLIIECGSATLAAWGDLVRAAPHRPATLVIVPRGGVHPLPAKPGDLH